MKRVIYIFVLLLIFFSSGCDEINIFNKTKTANNNTTANNSEFPNKITLANDETFNLFELLNIDVSEFTTTLRNNAASKLNCNNDGTLTTLSVAKNIKLTITLTKNGNTTTKYIYIDILNYELNGIDSEVKLFKNKELSFDLSLLDLDNVEYSYEILNQSKAKISLDGNTIKIKSANEDETTRLKITAKSGTIIKTKEVEIISTYKDDIVVELNEKEIGIIDDNKVIKATVKKDNEIIQNEVTFVSLDENIITIDQGGKITRISNNGFTKIYATVNYDGIEYQSNISNVVVFSKTEVKFNDYLSYSSYGRNGETSTALSLYETNSGFELYIYGNKLDAKFQQRGIKLRIVADGIESTVINEKNMNLATFDEVGLHKVYVAKATNSWHGKLTLESLSGALYYSNVEEKQYKFLFYGDSITVGYGINADGTDDSISNEDGTKTWAALVRDYYDANSQTLCKNGISAGAKIHCNELMYEIYDYCSYKYTTKYDLSKFVPDVIMINLGTNDNTALYNPGYGVASPSVKASDVTNGYLILINKLKEAYPDAKIVCMYGMMGCYKITSDAIKEAVATANETYDGSIYYLEMKQVSILGDGAHPDYTGQKQGAEQVIEFLESNKLLD